VFIAVWFSPQLQQRLFFAIKTSAFSRDENSGNDAAQFIQHMNEDKPNPLILKALVRDWLTNEFEKKNLAAVATADTIHSASSTEQQGSNLKNLAPVETSGTIHPDRASDKQDSNSTIQDNKGITNPNRGRQSPYPW